MFAGDELVDLSIDLEEPVLGKDTAEVGTVLLQTLHLSSFSSNLRTVCDSCSKARSISLAFLVSSSKARRSFWLGILYCQSLQREFAYLNSRALLESTTPVL